MQVTVLFFGLLTDITGANRLVLDNVPDTYTLIQQLNERYPGLQAAHCLLAVNYELVKDNTLLPENAEVALLPPYSGG